MKKITQTKARKKSISLPSNLADWVEKKAKNDRRSISSIVQEAIELLKDYPERNL